MSKYSDAPSLDSIRKVLDECGEYVTSSAGVRYFAKHMFYQGDAAAYMCVDRITGQCMGYVARVHGVYGPLARDASNAIQRARCVARAAKYQKLLKIKNYILGGKLWQK